MLDVCGILKEAIKVFGKEKQVLVAVEELSELQKELLKNVNRGEDNIDHIKEEIADVMITLRQLMIIYDLEMDEIDDVVFYKLKRLKGYLDERKQKEIGKNENR